MRLFALSVRKRLPPSRRWWAVSASVPIRNGSVCGNAFDGNAAPTLTVILVLVLCEASAARSPASDIVNISQATQTPMVATRVFEPQHHHQPRRREDHHNQDYHNQSIQKTYGASTPREPISPISHGRRLQPAASFANGADPYWCTDNWHCRKTHPAHMTNCWCCYWCRGCYCSCFEVRLGSLDAPRCLDL